MCVIFFRTSTATQVGQDQASIWMQGSVELGPVSTSAPDLQRGLQMHTLGLVLLLNSHARRMPVEGRSPTKCCHIQDYYYSLLFFLNILFFSRTSTPLLVGQDKGSKWPQGSIDLTPVSKSAPDLCRRLQVPTQG